MKKRLALLISVVLILSLTACGNTTKDTFVFESENLAVEDENSKQNSDVSEEISPSGNATAEDSKIIGIKAPTKAEYSELTSVTIGDYTFVPKFTDSQVLTWSVLDKDGAEYEKIVEPRMSESEYYQGKGNDSIYDWMQEIYSQYIGDYNDSLSDYKEISVIEEIKVLTGMEIDDTCQKYIMNMFFFMIDRMCYMPGGLEALSYEYGYFNFSILDLDKDGVFELLVSDNYSHAIYNPLLGNWEDSLVIGNIRAINIDDGILETIRGDMLGDINYYKYDGSDKNVIAAFEWEYDWDTDIESYYEIDSAGNRNEVSQEEAEKIRYDVVDCNSVNIIRVPFKPANILDYFYNN